MVPPGDAAEKPARSRKVVVTEVRVHGVGGARPHEILNRADIVPEPGTDRIAGFYRATQEDARRRLRAYSWGGMTSRKASRALWTLLLPFSFVNVAGWMMEPSRESGLLLERQGRSRTKRFERWWAMKIQQANRHVKATSAGIAQWQRLFVHVLSITVTATYVMWVAMLTVDLVGYQCGAAEACYEGRTWLEYMSAFKNRVGLRIVIGSLVPISLLFLFLWLSRRSRRRYDLYRAESETVTLGSEPPPLTSEDFWRQSDFITSMARIHFAVSMTVLAACLNYAMWRFSQTFDLVVTSVAGRSLMFLSAPMLVAALWAIWRMLRPPRDISIWERAVEWQTRTLFWASIALMAPTLAFVASLTTADEVVLSAGSTADHLWGFGWLTFGLLAVGILTLIVLTLLQLVRWGIDGAIDVGQFIIPVSFLFVAVWPYWWLFVSIAGFVLTMNLVVGYRRRRQRDTTGWMPWVVLIVVGVPSALFGRPAALVAVAVAVVVATYQWVAAAEDQDSFRWFGTAAVGAVGLLGLTGVLAGITLRLTELLEGGGFDPRLPAATEWTSLSTFLATVLAWVAGLVFFVAVWLHKRRAWRRQEEARWRERKAPIDRRTRSDIKSVVWWRAVAQAVRSVDVLITVYAMLLFSAAVAGSSWLLRRGVPPSQWLDQGVDPAYRPLLDVASWAELLYVGVAYLAVRSALRDEGWRRRLGMVWDVASFWPNRYHPFAPPAYAARAVPELIDRVKVHDAMARDDEGTVRATILSGHSQGSVLCFAAVAALDDETAGRVVLVTHGSPLGHFYRTFFPAVFTEEVFTTVGEKLYGSGNCRDGSWVNFYRRTDPIGGEVGRKAPGKPNPMPGLVDSLPTTALLPDAPLFDPCLDELNGRMRPHVRLHSDYDAEPCMQDTLDTLTAQMVSDLGKVQSAPRHGPLDAFTLNEIGLNHGGFTTGGARASARRR